MSYIPVNLRRRVIVRASYSCEYCLVHAAYSIFTHEVDHILAEKHGGLTIFVNLCYACAQCNRFKGSDLASIDPLTGEMARLFNPRSDNWSDHFVLDNVFIRPLTSIGRATERLLQLNQIDRILLRKELVLSNRYPFE